MSTLPILPLLIFFAELCVVTIGTVRIIFVARGMKVLAPVLGFFEIIIWLFAIGQIMQNLSNLSCYVAFAAGFTMGNFLGVYIEKKLAIGMVVVRIITNKNAVELIERLRAAEYGVTSIDAQGAIGPVTVVFTVIKRRELDNVASIIESIDPHIFYSVDEIQAATAGIFPPSRSRLKGVMPSPLRQAA